MQFLNKARYNNNIAQDVIVALSSLQNIPHQEGVVFWDAAQQCMAVYLDTPYVTLNPGRELLVRCHNSTGSTISNGKVVSVISALNEYPTIILADADNYQTNKVLGVATMDIPSGTWGEVTIIGNVHEINLSAFSLGDTLYLSAIPGELTNMRPQFPAKAVIIGQVTKNDATGTLFVSIHNDTYNYSYDGAIMETHTLTIIQSGANVYGEIERLGGGDLEVQVNGNIYKLNCTTNTGTNGKARVLLNNGTTVSVYTNYIYLTVSNNNLVLNTSLQYPSSSYAGVGTVSLMSATFTQSNGAISICPFIASQVSNGIGRVPLIITGFLKRGAVYDSGLLPTLNIDTTATPDSVTLSTTAGTCYMSELVNVPALNILTNGCHVANASGTGSLSKYQRVTNINQLMETAAGTPITNNQRYNLVFFIAASGKMFVNLPSATYSNDIDAYNDINNTAINTVPQELRMGGLLLLKLPLRYTTNSGGTYTYINPSGMPPYIDLRGTPIGVNQSSAYGLTPIFADATFEILDATDSTSKMKFNATNITPNNTRTLIMPDADVDLANLTVSNIATVSKTGIDSKLVTGTNGLSDTIAIWDANGDLISDITKSQIFNKSTDSTTDITEGTNLYFTDNRAITAVNNIITDTNSIDFTVSPTSIKADAKVDSTLQITASGLGLKANTILVSHIASSALATSGLVNNDKVTTQGYVDQAISASTASLLKLQGDWDASTNTPDISTTTTTGHAWRVSVAGSTSIGGITAWRIGDLVVKAATGWMKIDNNDISAVWGNITGTLSNQTDLWTVLGNKADIASLYTYLTDSSTITWAHTASPTTLTASIASNSISTSHIALSAKTGIQTKLVTGTNGTTSHIAQWNSNGDLVDGNIVTTNIFDKSVNTSDNITPGTTNLFFTNARAITAVTGIILDTATIDFSYDGSNLTAAVKSDNATITADSNGIKVGSITISNILASSKTGTGTKAVTATASGTNGNLAQWGANGDLSDSNFAVSSLFNKVSETTNSIQEGINNLYFTNARAITAINGVLTDSDTIDFTGLSNSITAVVKNDNSTLESSASGLRVKDGGITLAKIATANVQTGGAGDNTKLTTKGYVDNLSSIYALAVHSHQTTDITNFIPKTIEAFASVTLDPTGFLPDQQDNVNLSFNNSTRVLTLTPISGGAYTFYVKGVLYSKTIDTITLADTYLTQYVYYNNSGILTSTTTFDDTIITANALVTIINYDSGLKELALLQNELHGIMPSTVHLLWHSTLHAAYSSGMKLSSFDMTGTGATNAQAQFAISAGVFFDEDIKFNLDIQPLPSRIPLFYKQGANGYWKWNWTVNAWSVATAYTVGQRIAVGDNIFEVTVAGTSGVSQPTWVIANFGNTTTDNTVTWRLVANKTYPLIGGLGANNRLMYNQWTGSTWQLTEITANNSHVLIHIYASNNFKNANQDYDYIAILGQNEYNTLTQARTAAATEIASLVYAGGFPSNEVIPVGTIIVRTSNAFSNQPKAAFYTDASRNNYTDWTATKLNSGTAPTAHANLTGLLNDDHTQYLLLAGRSGGQTVIGGTLTGQDLTLRNNSADNVTVTVSGLNTHINTANIHVDHTTVSITGANSITGGGTIAANRTLSLVNDSATPGNNKVYGTNSSGTKGFFDRGKNIINFALPEQVDNTSVYFYSYEKPFEGTGTKIYSGNANGMSYANASSPIPMPYDGTITRAILTIKGAGVANGTVTYPVTYMTDLYNVGFTTEGTKIADLDFSISNTYTLGTYSVGATNATGIEITGLNIAVTKGQMLGLKFINGSGASQVGQMLNAWVALEIVPTI